MAELPSGTVTFFFTDIEGSTRLLKQLRHRYGSVLAEHERILRTAFAEAGGQEIDTQGDAFFVAFRRAGDAVAAAVAAQRGLAEHSWPDGSAVRVRIGIHSGEPLVGGTRYVGLGVHRAARICSAAHGGQVLLSDTARGLIEDDLPPDVRLRDLGQHRLKDLDRPERLFQLDIDGLQTDFPPPTAEPGDTDALVSGRELELAEAASASVSRFRRAGQRWPLVAAAGVALAGLAAAGLLLVTRSEEGSVTVPPNSLAAIDPSTNRVIKAIPLGGRPAAIAAGAGGLWVANIADRTLTRIQPESRAPADRIPLAGTPTGVAAGPSGVWVFYGLVGSVAHVDPQVGDVVETISDVVGRSSGGAIAQREGAVWVAGGSGEVVRIDPRTSRPSKALAVGFTPTAVAGGEGAIWVANGGSSTVSVVNPRTLSEVGHPSVGAAPRGVAVGERGIWVTSFEDDTVTRIDPVSFSTRTIPVGRGPTGIATGAGAIWVTNSEEGTVSRIDPERNGETKRILVGNRPEAIVVYAGVVWVVVQARS